jgi:hypothetical protein
MKKQISRVSLVQNGKLMAAIYFVLSIPFLLIMTLISVYSGGEHMSVPLIVGAALGYAASGFLGAVFGGWIYNLVAARIGGFEFTTVEVGAG